MCQCTPTPETGDPTPINIPSAWYDLSSRVSHAHAVARCIGESLPNAYGLPTEVWEALNDAANLAGAVIDLLTLAEQDVERLESQLKGVPA